MSYIKWEENNHSLNLDIMDCTHQEFISIINSMQAATNEEFVVLFEKLYIHTEKHFSNENKLMEQYSFSARSEHIGEHNRVLGEMRKFKERVSRGQCSFGRAYISEIIPQWFNLHVATMDSALAAHLKQVCNTEEMTGNRSEPA